MTEVNSNLFYLVVLSKGTFCVTFLTLTNFWKKKNEESCDTCIPITPNPIQSDHNRQFTKLAKKKAEQKIDKLIGFLKHIPDETTHLTNKLRSQLWMRWAMSWIRIINPLIKKESKTTTTISKLNQPPKI